MIEQHINTYRKKGILIDTNLLLLLLVGGTPSIKNFKRTNTYTSADYDLLIRLIDNFAKIIATPHILAEVSNLTNGLFGSQLNDFYGTLKTSLTSIILEIHKPASEIAENFSLSPYGLADVGIMAVAKNNYLVLTDDLRVASFALQNSVDVINFNHVRDAIWGN